MNLTRSLSIIIPAYNEESRLPDTLLNITNYLAQGHWDFLEILVVDDGSTDLTVQVAENYALNGCPVRVIRNDGNRGKGYSVKHGMLEARGEWLLLTDADLSTPIAELDKLWSALENEPAEIAIGSRAIDRSLIGVHQPAFREKAGQLFNWTMRRLLRLNIRDTQCGFKLFIGRKLNCSILEIAVRWNNVEGSKVSLWNGASSFLDLMRVRLNDMRGIYKL